MNWGTDGAPRTCLFLLSLLSSQHLHWLETLCLLSPQTPDQRADLQRLHRPTSAVPNSPKHGPSPNGAAQSRQARPGAGAASVTHGCPPGQTHTGPPSCTLTPPLPGSLRCTLTPHGQAHTHTPLLLHTHTLVARLAHIHTYVHSYPYSQTVSHPHSYTLTLLWPDSHASSLFHTHTLTLTLTHGQQKLLFLPVMGFPLIPYNFPIYFLSLGKGNF